jgi:predicted GIY-YIG superfamily endonuclease
MKMYIYVLKMDDTPIYIGKSHQPTQRWSGHKNSKIHNKFNKMEIIDVYEDPEQDYINEYKNKGYILENKNRATECENLKVGDVIDKFYTKSYNQPLKSTFS